VTGSGRDRPARRPTWRRSKINQRRDHPGATDIFAVGCLLYELLAYHKPFEGETVHGVLYQVLTTDRSRSARCAVVPAALEGSSGKAINKVPEERFETAREISRLCQYPRRPFGASDTTERLHLRWAPIPSAVLPSVRHAPIKWRAAGADQR